jgi:hypothetical protein
MSRTYTIFGDIEGKLTNCGLNARAALATPLQRGQAGYAIRSLGKYDKVVT